MGANDVKDALLKCAGGFTASETVEEFATDGDGQLRLVKKKVTVREIPPDIKAVKLLMDGGGEEEMTDEQLSAEREKLLKMLKEN